MITLGMDATSERTGNGNGENPRRIFRRAFYVALGGLIASGIGWAGKQGGEALLRGVHEVVRAEISVHHAVAVHTQQLADHEDRLQHVEAQASARVALPPDARAQLAQLIKLLEADAKARDRKATRP